MSKQLYTSDICVSGGNDKWSCHRPAVSDGYCKIHHPDAVAAIQHKNGNNCDHRAQLSITNYGPCVVCGESQDSILMKRIAALEETIDLERRLTLIADESYRKRISALEKVAEAAEIAFKRGRARGCGLGPLLIAAGYLKEEEV